jgi:hypothetical protein
MTSKRQPAERPTIRASSYLDRAHQFFNRELFGGSLPNALITFQRHARAYGYFSGARFYEAHGDDSKHTDEIAMNPLHFAERTVDKTLSTLAHEMAHQWQRHHGKEPSRCYHDKEWADKMEAIGLMPSTTGMPGGKRTGPKVTHYIIEGGPFAKACAAFMKANDASLYQDRAREILSGKGKGGEGEGEGEGEGKAKKKSKGRIKFQCKGCELNAWAKPSAKLRCMDCDRPLHSCEPEAEKEGDDDED